MVFTDDSNATFLSTDLPRRVAAKKDAIFRAFDYLEEKDINLTIAAHSVTESEYASFQKGLHYATAI